MKRIYLLVRTSYDVFMKPTYAHRKKECTNNLRLIVRTLFMKMAPGHIPAGTWRLYNVATTSMQRHDVASTLWDDVASTLWPSPQRRCNVMTLHRRCGDVVLKLCACWDINIALRMIPIRANKQDTTVPQSLEKSFRWLIFYISYLSSICRFSVQGLKGQKICRIWIKTYRLLIAASI